MTVSYLPQIGEGELPEPTYPKIAYIPRMEMANLDIRQKNHQFHRCPQLSVEPFAPEPASTAVDG